MRAWLTRTLAGCIPADADSAAVLKRIPVGTTFETDVITKQSRSTAFHRRYWLLVSQLAAHVDHVTIDSGVTLPVRCAEDMHVALKYLTGLYDQYVLEGAGVVRIIRSTAFDKMTAEEWAAHYQRVLDAVHQHVLPGVEIREVEEELGRLAS